MKLIEFCKGLPTQTFNKGEVILKEGAKTGMLYILVDGCVEVTKQGVLLNKASEPGTLFGEISALLDIPHTATVTVLEQSTFYAVKNASAFIANNPQLAIVISRILAQRLTTVTTSLANVKQSLDKLMKLQVEKTFRSLITPKFEDGNLFAGEHPVVLKCGVTDPDALAMCRIVR